jgi:hypothetical protein
VRNCSQIPSYFVENLILPTSLMRISKPRPLEPNSIGRIMTVLLDKTGVRPYTQSHSKTSLMQCHGLRKFFDTQCINHNMNPLHCEYLMGHKSGLIKSYFKPTDTELLEGKAMIRALAM